MPEGLVTVFQGLVTQITDFVIDFLPVVIPLFVLFIGIGIAFAMIKRHSGGKK